MYCPVYGCSSDSQKNADDQLHFFTFPHGPEDKNRRKVWIEFCKRKSFVPTKSTCICSLHFINSDAYVHSQSPEFLKSINFDGKKKCRLNNDAVPTKNKPGQQTTDDKTPETKRSTGTYSRRKETEDIIKKYAESEDNNKRLEATISSELTSEPNTTICSSQSISVQTEPELILPKRQKMTQTEKLPTISKTRKDTRSVKTQTHMTDEYFISKSIVHSVSAATQTDQGQGELVQDCSSSNKNEIFSSTCESDTLIPLSSDPIVESLTDEEFELSNDEVEEQEAESDENLDDDAGKSNKQIILSSNKSPQEQIKFIVFEESIVNRFGICFKCNSACIVSIGSRVGTHCALSVCCTVDSNHDFVWSTGPMHNRLPLLHLMIASSVISTGMECEKMLRFFNSLKIDCFNRREFTNLQAAYVIPAVFSVWEKEQVTLLQKVKNKPCSIASDMRVDSPGHTGLFGSGSSLDVERNVILDTQIIKVKHYIVCSSCCCRRAESHFPACMYMHLVI